jgi:MFS family permease
MLQPLVIAERFGVRDYPRLFSRTQLVAVVGTAGGPLLLGALYDVSGSYQVPYAVAACCSLVGAIVLSMGGPATVDGDAGSSVVVDTTTRAQPGRAMS